MEDVEKALQDIKEQIDIETYNMVEAAKKIEELKRQANALKAILNNIKYTY
jgi:hypothetical protein